MKALELKIPPPIVVLLFGLAMWGVARRLPAIDVDWQWRLIIANVCATFGVSTVVLGFRAFQRAKTTVSPVNPQAATSLVTGSVYSYTRNPMYTGLTMALLGWAIWLSVPWIFLGPVAFALYITRFQIIPEERVMSSKFGRDYDEYRKRVRRWV